jgi:hypothetical protein
MADLKITGRMSVERLQREFKASFGGSLRVYNGSIFADPKATLASIRKGDASGGEFTASGNMFCGRFEKEVLEKFGIKVQVATKDNTALVADNTSLSKLEK